MHNPNLKKVGWSVKRKQDGVIFLILFTLNLSGKWTALIVISRQFDHLQCLTLHVHTLLHILEVIFFSLKEVPTVVVSCRGWDSFTKSDDSVVIILLSPNTCTVPSKNPSIKLALLISLSSVFLSAAEMLLLWQTTP